ncbi:hypothetical protein C8F04DRAFT_1391055 [Mycena alexandri]|uniref:Extracellular mutant protein 11 C-terminal domain-containing protein n=1 Tax=Mycena alexandri TaxID=1745969 RepID=A0AAD6T8M0_9AGAR|nr:hypothetical protein C8F04DRAFT_1391055 [Mycena alexandri]
MSARHPFVFGGPSRPESRSTGAGLAAPPTFVADPSNPLNGGPIGNNPTKDRTETADNRPLNIGSLTKGNRSQNPPSRRQSMQAPSRPATSDPHSISTSSNHPMRPGTSDPHSKPKPSLTANHRVQAHGIVAPTPLQARSTPSMFSNNAQSSSLSSNFKTPALPGSRLSPAQSSDPFRAPANDQMVELQQQSPEESQADTLLENSSYRLNVLPSQPGPHRIVFGARPVTDLTQDDDIYEVPESDVVRGRNKRGRSEVEDDDDKHERVQGYAKRFKAGQQQADENAYPLSSYDGNEMYHRGSTSSPHDLATQEYPPAQQQRQQHRHSSGSRAGDVHPPHPLRGFPPQAQYANTNVDPARSSARGAHSQADADAAPSAATRQLVQLLKADNFDLALDAKVEKYTQLTEKWKGCTREEWLDGAQELTALYNKIFDFAKSHMAAKLQLFATCDKTLHEANEVLKDRDGLLVEVKDKLVAESGHVLGKV